MKNENKLCFISIEDTINISHNPISSKNSLIKLNDEKSEKVLNDEKNAILPKENKSLQESENPKKLIPFFDDNQYDYYSNLLQEEEKLNTIPLYGYMVNQPDINEAMRMILVNWLIDAHYQFKFSERTLYQTIWIIDAYLSKKKIARKNLQLLGVSAFYISIKQNEIIIPNLYQLVLLVDYAYEEENIIQFEKKILKVLSSKISAPTSCHFYNMISMAFNFDESQFFFGKYFLDTCLIDYQMNKYSASVIGVACAYIVMKFFGIYNEDELFTKGIIKDNNPEKLIKDAARDIHLLMKNLESNPSFQAAKNKYSLKEYSDVMELFDL